MIVASMTVATVQPMSMGRKRSLRPIIMGMPTGMSMQLAMEKVAPEIEVCRRFCRWMLLNFLKTRRGIRDSTTANSAPMIDVLGAHDKLHADDTAERAHYDAEDQAPWVVPLGMFLRGDLLLGEVLDFTAVDVSALIVH